MAKWAIPGIEATIRAKAKAVGSFFGWRRFDDFAVAKIFNESRGNPYAVGHADDFGWFQILPDTAGIDPGLLLDPDYNMAAAAHLSVRLANNWGGPFTNWVAVWRGMKAPRFTDDWLWRETPAATRERMNTARHETGVSWWALRELVGKHTPPNLDVLVALSRGAK
jgi:hypothetical protein